MAPDVKRRPAGNRTAVEMTGRVGAKSTARCAGCVLESCRYGDECRPEDALACAVWEALQGGGRDG